MNGLNQNKIFNEEFESLYFSICEIRKLQDDWRYPYLPDEEYTKITNPITGAEIYWKEILYRTHIAVLVSLFKAVRWIDGLKYANEQGSYYSFVANLRGLIEACSDSFFTLRYIPLTIAKDFEAIFQSVHKTTRVQLTHKNLEEILIHFSHASKIDKSIKKDFSEYLNAKQVREYLNSIMDENKRLDDLYSYLCQVSHPAAQSNAIFLFHENNDMIVCGDSFQLERKLIQDLSETFSEIIQNFFRLTCLNCFECLKLLNMFHIKELQTTLVYDNTLNEMETWKEVLMYIKESRIKYQKGVETGKYD